MAKTEVIFFDGQSSIGNKATLNLTNDCWLICYSDLEFQKRSIKWNIAEIHKVEIINGIHVFRYGKFPQQVLECIDNNFVDVLKQYYPNEKFLKYSSFSIKNDWKYLSTAALLFLAILLSIYFLVLPPAAEFLAGKIPKELEINFGNTLLKNFISDNKVDKKLSALTNKFASNIIFNSSYPIEITVIKEEEVNAFALPGGKIVIYDHILKKINSAEELAALLSHEVAHVEYKHSLKSICRSLSGYMFISLLLNDINGMTSVLVDNANALNNLGYSRALERTADERALVTLNHNNLDQDGLVRLFKVLKAQQEEHDFMKFLSTHPLSTERIKYAKEASRKQKYSKKNEILDKIWLEIKNQVNNQKVKSS